ncbi:putative transcription factor GRAS family [Rosa chinensis]|uniref:Putative transcription factor GRAS family n=2 Tax=Rosa chinensis TaxID=74649 RepID=A0A2P6SCD5_ROSCH|nr:putative transcription factor GRAS family [Rosa chinensis]
MSSVCRLSTVEIMRAAGARFIQFSSQKYADDSIPKHVLGCAPIGLSDQEVKEVELAHLLLAFADKVGKQQYDRARKLQNLCHFLSSSTGNTVQRVVYYFSKALRERTDRETGRNTSKGSESKDLLAMHLENTIACCPAFFACFLKLPFYQVTQFAGIQAIVESVASAKRVHFIDLEIRSGGHCIVLMQALASRCEQPIEMLKVTAVGSGTASRQKLEDTGKRLAQFAEALHLPFSFKIATVTDINNLNEDGFESEDGEATAVYCCLMRSSMRTLPDCLESAITELRKLNPCLMVITEIEANLYSPVFEDRFNAAVFYYSAYFDCLDVCMDNSSPYRRELEETFLAQQITNIIASEEERKFRHMKIDVWRSLFAKFGMVEAELSLSSLYQADLTAKQFACGKSCTLDMNGKCLTIGWKGTTILSLSSWKFHAA